MTKDSAAIIRRNGSVSRETSMTSGSPWELRRITLKLWGRCAAAEFVFRAIKPLSHRIADESPAATANTVSNYFCLGPVSRAYRAIDRHGRHRLRQWLCAKHQVKSRGTSRFPDQYLNDKLGLLRLSARTKSFPWAKG